jgi:hypothetical protein
VDAAPGWHRFPPLIVIVEAEVTSRAPCLLAVHDDRLEAEIRKVGEELRFLVADSSSRS